MNKIIGGAQRLNTLQRTLHYRVVREFSWAKRLSDYEANHVDRLSYKMNLFVMGSNQSGQTGLKHQSPSPVILDELKTESVVHVSNSESHTLALTDNGGLWIWGQNKHQGALLKKTAQKHPAEISHFHPNRVIDAGVGIHHSIFLIENAKGDRFVYATGSNELGQCGIGGLVGEGASVGYPHTVGIFTSLSSQVTKLAVGFHHNLALTEAGEVYSWGSGVEGQLGHGDGNDQIIPKLIENIPPMSNVFAFGDVSGAVSVSGDLYLWGANEYHQLGYQTKLIVGPVPEKLKLPEQGKVISVGLGATHTVVVNEHQSVFGWGSNKFGQLGIEGREEEYTSPHLIESLSTKNIKSVACGGFHTICISEMGIPYSFGEGADGRLGHEDSTSYYTPHPIRFFKGSKVVKAHCGMETTFLLVKKQ